MNQIETLIENKKDYILDLEINTRFMKLKYLEDHGLMLDDIFKSKKEKELYKEWKIKLDNAWQEFINLIEEYQKSSKLVRKR